MLTPPNRLLPLLPGRDLTCQEVRIGRTSISIVASSNSRSARCPACRTDSIQIHSRYVRTLRDLPWQGTTVRVELSTRRFYCRIKTCPRKVFTERLPAVATVYSRQTARLANILRLVGYALGGESGCRLAERFGIECSPDLILRKLKADSCADCEGAVKVLGIDDWAWRKGDRYGTILVDLERRRPVDLLPDRSVETVEKWLRKHPEVEIVSRDRAGAYAEAVDLAAPTALQIADRWHVLCNLTQALRRMLDRLSNVLREVRPAEIPLAGVAAPVSANEFKPGVQGDKPKLDRQQQLSQERRERRMARYQSVWEAHKRGSSDRAIARELHIGTKTVQRYLSKDEFPEQAPRQRRTAVAKFRPYLERRWAEGCRNAAQLWREIRSQGFQGKRSAIRDFLQSWRGIGGPPKMRRPPAARVLALWLVKPNEEKNLEQSSWTRALVGASDEIAQAELLSQEFRRFFQHRDASGLEDWLSRVKNCAVAEMRGFAAGIVRDCAAVSAGIEQPWSNGQVEGQVHRLKLVKRQMYGRAGFELLRRRVLRYSNQPSAIVPKVPP